MHLDGSFAPEELHKLLLERHARDPFLESIPVSVPLPWSGETLPVRQLLLKCCEEKTAAPRPPLPPPQDPSSSSSPPPIGHQHPPHGDAWSSNLSVFANMCICTNKRSLNKMLDSFALFMPLVAGDLSAITRLSDMFVDRLVDSNVFYCEVRYSPHLLCGDVSVSPPPVSARAVVSAVAAGLKAGCDRVNASRKSSSTPPIVVTQILCMLCWFPQWSDDVVTLADEFRLPEHLTQHLGGRGGGGSGVGAAASDRVLPQSEPLDATSLTGFVVGVDLAAGEAHFDRTPFAIAPSSLVSSHSKAFVRAGTLGLHRCCHAGEVPGACGNSSSDELPSGGGIGGGGGGGGGVATRLAGGLAVERAVLEYGAERIGHGYLLFQDDGASGFDTETTARIVNLCNERKVHFEVCPTSSFETGGWHGDGAEEGDWKKHPIRKMLSRRTASDAEEDATSPPSFVDIPPGVSLSISSDDPAVFTATLTGEYGLVSENMGVGERRVAETVRDAIDAAFVPDWAKRVFRRYVEEWFEREMKE